MTKKAISVTLKADNLLWLKGRAGAVGVRSVSELLDRLVTQARTGGPIGASRSVVGTIDVDGTDPLLDHADQAVRAVFDASLRRPLVVKEPTPEYRGRPGSKQRG